ncbi:MAG TPA: nucleotidyltransferase family protein [Verrucomicrobiae bacterium]|nr:nucleotidyltransferase family protein [Verrucomicrobiae bacterium]
MPQPLGPIKPEIELLLYCAHNPSDVDVIRRQRLARLLFAGLDWNFLIQFADDNGILPLFCEHLAHFPSISIPAEISNRLREENRQHSMRALSLTAELLRICDALRGSGVAFAPWKGPALAQTAYGGPSLRQFDDLDFVAEQKSMPQIYDAMESLGYQAKLSRGAFALARGRGIPGEYVFVHAQHGALVEFHTERTLRHFPHAPRVGEMLRRASAVIVDSRIVPAFSPADDLLMLAVHGAKDFWARLIWVADIAATAAKLSSADWELLRAEAKKCGATCMLNVALCLAHSILSAPMNASAAEDALRDGAALRIAQQIRDYLLGVSDAPLGIVWRSRYRISMGESALKGLRYWIRLSTAPAEEDWSAAHGIPKASPAHVLLRPLRLWRKFARGRVSRPLGSEDN